VACAFGFCGRSVGGAEEKRHLGQPILGWEDNNGIEIKTKEWMNVTYIHVAQDKVLMSKLLKMALRHRVP
jgi:hypothetical protein